jgi:hypothetical protein
MKRAISSCCRIVAAAILGVVTTASALAWERPHADGANSGFADVDTAPAAAPAVVPSIGTFAAGAGPAIAPDGTVYLGNKEGQLIALQADGTRKWTQGITLGFSIVASPVVGGDGSIYAVGTRTVKNQQVDPPLIRYDAGLYKFTPAGALAWETRFPNAFDGPTSSAAPNIWRIPGESDVVMVPVDYKNRLTGGYDTNIVAISTTGAILDNVKVKTVVYQVTGGSDLPSWCLIPLVNLGCLLGPDFNPSGGEYVEDPATKLPENTVAPRPGVAIVKYSSVIEPFILVSNQFQDFVAYSFPNRQFREQFRVHDESRTLLSTPMVMADGHTVIATSGDKGRGSIAFLGPNMVAWAPVKGPLSYAAATRLADGRTAIVELGRRMTILSGKNQERTVPLPGESIVSAAASRTHLFVSTAGSFLTYDPSTWEKRAEIFWVGGGTFTPAIGPFGHVYGMANNVLFVFPPPVPAQVGGKVANPDGPLVADPSPPAATPASKRYSGPVTGTGHRLFACQELDGDDCGKSTSKAVALAFCQQQGFAEAAKVDTETRKGKAARLDGQFCTKSRCKVFDEILCKK